MYTCVFYGIRGILRIYGVDGAAVYGLCPSLHLLFECPALADLRAAFPDDNELHLADGDLGCLMDEVYRLRQWRLF
jgi:hypothetical protein